MSFFLTQILSDPALCDAVVVFDDPFNSQDMNRQFETASRIREVARKARQTIVLSHDPRFLFMIEKDSEKATTKTFQLTCNDEGGGAITSWSSEDELKSLYIRQGEMIREYAHQGKLLSGTDINGVLQAIRPFLEDYIRLRFPGRFSPMEHLPAMAAAIRDAGMTDPMYDSVEDLLALNEYTRPNMHGGSDAPEPDALRAQTRKVVKIVGRY